MLTTDSAVVMVNDWKPYIITLETNLNGVIRLVVLEEEEEEEVQGERSNHRQGGDGFQIGLKYVRGEIGTKKRVLLASL
jgi:hypothetical protein